MPCAGSRVMLARLEERATGPGGRHDVHVLLLEADGHEEIAPPGEESGRLRTADRLAAAERDEVGARVDEPPQVGPRRQIHRGIDEDRQVVRMSDGHELGDREADRLAPDRCRTRRPWPTR